MRVLGDIGQKKDNRTGKAAPMEASTKAILDFVESLDASNAQTSRTVILSTFQTWQKHVIRSKRAGKAKERHAADALHHDQHATADEDIDPDESGDPLDPETLKMTLSRNELKIPRNLFSLQVIDEAHRVKDPKALQTDAAFLQEDISTLLVTATPAKTTIEDWSGLLRFMFKNVNPELHPTEENEGKAVKPLTYGQYRRCYQEFERVLDCDILKATPDQARKLYRALDPTGFLQACRSTGNDVKTGADIVPLVVALCMLRRVKGTELDINGEKITIGAEIPPWECRFVELKPGAAQAGLYRGIEVATSTTGNDDSPSAGTRRRRLMLAAYDPAFDQFAERKISANAPVVNKV